MSETTDLIKRLALKFGIKFPVLVNAETSVLALGYRRIPERFDATHADLLAQRRPKKHYTGENCANKMRNISEYLAKTKLQSDDRVFELEVLRCAQRPVRICGLKFALLKNSGFDTTETELADCANRLLAHGWIAPVSAQDSARKAGERIIQATTLGRTLIACSQVPELFAQDLEKANLSNSPKITLSSDERTLLWLLLAPQNATELATELEHREMWPSAVRGEHKRPSKKDIAGLLAPLVEKNFLVAVKNLISIELSPANLDTLLQSNGVTFMSGRAARAAMGLDY